jgi:hypothetical protein
VFKNAKEREAARLEREAEQARAQAAAAEQARLRERGSHCRQRHYGRGLPVPQHRAPRIRLNQPTGVTDTAWIEQRLRSCICRYHPVLRDKRPENDGPLRGRQAGSAGTSGSTSSAWSSVCGLMTRSWPSGISLPR